MNQLQKEILQAILKVDSQYAKVHGFSDAEIDEWKSKEAAEVCLRWIERAIDETKGYYTDSEYITGKSKEEWLKYNGLTE